MTIVIDLFTLVCIFDFLKNVCFKSMILSIYLIFFLRKNIYGSAFIFPPVNNSLFQKSIFM